MLKRPLVGRVPAFLLPLVLLSLLLTSVGILAVQSSPTAEFNVTPDSIELNWTNNYQADIMVETNATINYTALIAIANTTNTITSNYSQQSRYSNSTYSQFWWTSNPGCFHTGIGELDKDNPLAAFNASNSSQHINSANMTNGTNQNYTVWHNVTCPPGRYWGLINTTNSSEFANITATVIFPISTVNTLNDSTGVGAFLAAMPGNASGYHSYWFNTSNMTNRGVTINLSWGSSSKDLDIFLLNWTGSLKAKSIERANESLTYSYLPADEVWEIRVFGNFTAAEDYDGYVYFSTLNATNSTNDTITLIDFGLLAYNGSSGLNVTLWNDGSLTPNVTEDMEVYHIEQFSGNGSGNFSFLVPASASRVRAGINWTGGANYTLSLYKPSGVLVGNSSDKGHNANVTGVEYEEWVETTGITEGLWEFRVTNNTNITADVFTGTVKFWVAPGSWLGSNFSAMRFNSTGNPNSSQDFPVNVTVPSTAISGLYEGYFKYITDAGAVLPVPFRVNATTPVLFVNGSFQSATISLSDNIGFNRSGGDVNFSVIINNTGNQVLNLTSTNSTYLFNQDNSSYYMEMSYSPHDASIAGNFSGQLDVNISINNEKTQNAQGLYSGWIYLNSSSANESHPYPGFNLSITVNLTNALMVNVTQILYNWVYNTSAAHNVTPFVSVKYQNGSNVTGLTLDNFSFWMEEGNTSYRVPPTGNLSIHNKSGGGVEENEFYKPNVTVPSYGIGGFYHLYATATHTVGSTTLYGTGDGGASLVVINDTGLQITPVTGTSLTITEGQSGGGSTLLFNATVTNYGPLTATGNIHLANGSGHAWASPETNGGGSGCGTGGGSATDYFTSLSIPGNGTRTCWYAWKINSHNVTSDKTVTFTLTTDSARFNNVSVSVIVDDSDGGGGDGAGVATCNTDADCAASYNCTSGVCTLLDCGDDQYIADHTCVDYIYKLNITGFEPYTRLLLGASNTTKVEVNNTGNGPVTTKLDVTIDSGITASVSPSSYSLDPGEMYNFTVNLSVSEDATTGNHTGTFKAYMSTKASTVYNTTEFVVYVVPTEEREAEINTSYQSHLTTLANLTSEFNTIKASGFISPENLTAVQTLFDEADNLTYDIAVALAAGEYVEAEALLRQLDDTFDRIRDGFTTLKVEQEVAGGEFQSTLWVWGVAGVIIIAAAAFFIYMLLPPKGGYRAGRGFKFPGKRAAGPEKAREKVKNVFGRGGEHLKRAREKVKKKGSSRRGFKYRYKR